MLTRTAALVVDSFCAIIKLLISFQYKNCLLDRPHIVLVVGTKHIANCMIATMASLTAGFRTAE